MQVSSLLVVLSNFEGIVASAGGSGTAAALRELRQLFAGNDAVTVATFVNKLIKQRDLQQRGSNTPPIANLRAALEKLEGLLRSAEGKKAADDVAKLVTLLDGCGHGSVAGFVSEARGWLSKPAKAKSGKGTTKKSPMANVETLLPAEYVLALKEAEKDNMKFDALVDRLRADRSIKKAEMRDIARQYLGYEIAKKKGRADALVDIVDRQAVDARQDARGSLLDRLKPW